MNKIIVAILALTFYLVVIVVILFGSNQKYMQADSEPAKPATANCQQQISGTISYTHWRYQNQIRLKLYSNNQQIAETISDGKNFNLSFVAPNDESNIFTLKAEENSSGQAIKYDVANLKGLKCGENNNIDISL